MGLFDNIIGTANDGEAATDMDTIIENMANPKQQETDEVTTSNVANTTGGGSGSNNGDDSK